MKTFKTLIALILVSSQTILIANCQTNDECKYLMVLTYLRTNKKINETIKTFFPKISNKKDKYVDFNLSNRIDFISISAFKDKLNGRDSRINNDLLNDPNLYYKKYFFESFKSEFLDKIFQPNDSKLFLTFSKSVEDYLIVEIGNFNPEVNQKIKFGKGLLMLFEFDTLGVVKDVLISGAAYN